MSLKILVSTIIFVFIFQFFSCSQTEVIQSGRYSYETVKGDPLKARIYTLDNGLKVYMTVYKNEPRIQTMIPIRAGSKNDPAQSTGLAHYLEHLLFKGTNKYSTNDFEKEKPLLDEIVNLYEQHRQESILSYSAEMAYLEDSYERLSIFL